MLCGGGICTGTVFDAKKKYVKERGRLMKQQIRAELKQGIVRRWYLYILPFALGAVSTAAFLNRYALLEAL